jgi:hypothetical protein
MTTMSVRTPSPRYGSWRRGQADADARNTGPRDCDCGDTIRELLAEIAGTAAVFVLILSIVRALH